MMWFDDILDFKKTNDGYELEVDVPGFNKTNLTVSSPADNEILITGKTKTREFKKQITVPFDISTTTAELKDGVLVLKWKERKPKQHLIEIK